MYWQCSSMHMHTKKVMMTISWKDCDLFKSLLSSLGAIWIHLVFMSEQTSDWLWEHWEQNERDSNQAEVMEWHSEIDLDDRAQWRDIYTSQPSSGLLASQRWEEESSSGEISQFVIAYVEYGSLTCVHKPLHLQCSWIYIPLVESAKY